MNYFEAFQQVRVGICVKIIVLSEKGGKCCILSELTVKKDTKFDLKKFLNKTFKL